MAPAGRWALRMGSMVLTSGLFLSIPFDTFCNCSKRDRLQEAGFASFDFHSGHAPNTLQVSRDETSSTLFVIWYCRFYFQIRAVNPNSGSYHTRYSSLESVL